MTERVIATDDETSAIIGAARRTVRRLEASEEAITRYVELRRRGDLGRNVVAPPRTTEEKRERVKASRESLQRQANPLAQRPPAEETRTNLPTPERRALIDTAIETYATTVRAGRDMASEAWRVVPVVEAMRRSGQLGEAQERAAERFYRDFVLGHRIGGLTSSYGQSTGGGVIEHDDLRSDFHTRFIAACRAIGHYPTIEWMVRIVCEQLTASETRPPKLADAGRNYMAYKDQKQAQAAGATLLKTGLDRLAKHYGLDIGQGKR